MGRGFLASLFLGVLATSFISEFLAHTPQAKPGSTGAPGQGEGKAVARPLQGARLAWRLHAAQPWHGSCMALASTEQLKRTESALAGVPW